MLEALKQEVYKANMLLPKHNLVTFTWGNVSGVCRESGMVVIKPSGVEYDVLKADDMVVVRLADGSVAEGSLNPSSDTQTHLVLYREMTDIGGIVHTHSRWATIFAQEKREIPVLGTTHADYFAGPVPCTRQMRPDEIRREYEQETGNVIVEISPNYDKIPAALVASHGPFVWGKTPIEATHNAIVLEEVAFMAWHNTTHSPKITPISHDLLRKHYYRKHGAEAYYGQAGTVRM